MSRPIKVALVTHVMRLGGVETFLLRLGRYLRQAGCEVEMITTSQRGEWYHRISESRITAKAITKRRWASGLLHALRVGRTLARGQYDVIFFNHAKFAQRSLGLLPDKPVVIPVLHNDRKDIYELAGANASGWNVAVAVGQKVYEVARSRIPGRPIVHIPYGVEMPAEAVWQQRRQFERPLKLVFVGRLTHEQKGVNFLPEILARSLQRGIDATLTIAGEGEDREQLSQRIAECGLQDRLQLQEPLPPEGVYDLLLDSHVFVLPSFHEGLPIVLLEAQACGCVPVASRLRGITDQAIEDGQTGTLVDVGDVSGFVNALVELYENPSRWTQISRAGHARIAQHFSVEAMGQSYQRLIRDALDGCYPLAQPRKHLLPGSLFKGKL